MFNWLKSLFGSKVVAMPTPVVEEALLVLEPEQRVETPAELVVETKQQPKKAKVKKTKKEAVTCDFTKLTKPQLLAEAKQRGVKANASLKKEEIIERLNQVV